MVRVGLGPEGGSFEAETAEEFPNYGFIWAPGASRLNTRIGAGPGTCPWSFIAQRIDGERRD